MLNSLTDLAKVSNFYALIQSDRAPGESTSRPQPDYLLSGEK